jgi:hypothetical protein
VLEQRNTMSTGLRQVQRSELWPPDCAQRLECGAFLRLQAARNIQSGGFPATWTHVGCSGEARLKGADNTAQGNALGIRAVRPQALKRRQSQFHTTGTSGEPVSNGARGRTTSRPFRAKEPVVTVFPGRYPGLYYCRPSGEGRPASERRAGCRRNPPHPKRWRANRWSARKQCGFRVVARSAESIWKGQV